ncbi:MAG: hypothetical protein ABIX01_21540 [Chitinophagaceae bacterium]
MSIPEPCSNSWEKMAISNEGRFCGSCATTVIDFTKLTDEAIQDYFIQHLDSPVCGRFKTRQLDRITIYLPTYLLQEKKTYYWQKFLIVLLICFGNAMLPVEINPVSSQALYAQHAEGSGSSRLKKKSKKRHRSTFTFVGFKRDQFTTYTAIIMGNMVCTPIPDAAKISMITEGSVYKKSNSGNADTIKSNIAARKENGQGKSPAKEIPFQTTQAILPTAFTFSSRPSRRGK